MGLAKVLADAGVKPTVRLTLDDVERIRKLVEEIKPLAWHLFGVSASMTWKSYPYPRDEEAIKWWTDGISYFLERGEEDAERLLELVKELRTWLEVILERSVEEKAKGNA